MLDSNPLEITWENRPLALCPRVVKSFSIRTAYLGSTDSFELSVYDSDPARLRGLALEPVTLSIHGAQQIIGRIDLVSRGNDGSVTLQGRDFLADMVECNVDPTFKIGKADTLNTMILNCAGPVGIDMVFGDSDVSMRNVRTGIGVRRVKQNKFDHFQPGDLIPDPGQGMFDFLSTICARHGCTIQPANTRSGVVLSAPVYDSESIAHLIRSTSAFGIVGNVDSAESVEDYSSFPTWAMGVGNVVSSGGSAKSTKAEYPGTAFGTDPLRYFLADKIELARIKPTDAPKSGSKLYRLLYFKDKLARSVQSVERSITRAISERLKETLIYRATLKGFRDERSGAVYSVDTMIDVDDDVCDIHEPLWVASREFVGNSSSAETRLEMWRPYTFIVS